MPEPKQPRPRIVVRVERPEAADRKDFQKALKACNVGQLDVLLYCMKSKFVPPKPFDAFTICKHTGLTFDAFVEAVRATVQRKAG